MFYPMMIDLKDKYICIIGAGGVAFGRAKKYLEYEARVVVVGKSIKDEFHMLKNIFNDKLTIVEGNFDEWYLKNVFLVEIATDDRQFNSKICNICKKNNILCNVVDAPGECDYIVPAIVKRGSLIISISTLGKSPSFSSKIRKELENRYDDSIAEFVDLLGEGRNLVLQKNTDVDKKRLLLNKMANMTKDELIEAITKLEER